MTRLTEEQLTELEAAYSAAVECRTTHPAYVVWHTEADTRVMALLRPALPSLLAEVRESRKAISDASVVVEELLAAFDEHVNLPEPDCQCVVSPPCNDCVDFAFARKAVAAARSFMGGE